MSPRRGFLGRLAALIMAPWAAKAVPEPVRWIEDDANLRFVPTPGEPHIGYYELLEPEPPPLTSARIVDLKDPYEE